jgi:hypothetical protein
MQFILLCFVVLTILTTTSTQIVLERPDGCYSNEDIAVPYTLWVGTNVTTEYNIFVTVAKYTTFYDVMEEAEYKYPDRFR